VIVKDGTWDALARLMSRSWRSPGDDKAVAGVVGLVVAAAIVGRWLLAEGFHLYLPFPPLLAEWMPHIGPGTPAAVVIAVAVVARGPELAERLSWRPLLVLAWVASAAWTLALALVDGWQRGVAGRLTSDDEYLHDVPRAPGLGALLREFGAHILTNAVDPGQTWFWTTHVGGHPPGIFLLFVLLDRVGLGGGGPAALLVVLVGAAAGAAVAVTARALGDEQLARRALPYAVLFPGAVWVGVSADGLFAGWLAWGVALLAVGATSRGVRADIAAVGGGLLLGASVYLSYGLVLGGLLALAAVTVAAKRQLTHTVRGPRTLRDVCVDYARCVWGGSGRAVALAALSAALVVLAFTLAGFSWLDGYAKVRVIYAASVAAARPYSYFVWANLAAFAFALGPAGVAGLRRYFTGALAARPATAVVGHATGGAARPALGPRIASAVAQPQLLVVAAMAAVLLADLSGMSKAEVERIWLPFAVWTALACADLPHPRRWLAAQAILALLVNHLLLTVW
jgi:methylthioxylose transferase